MTCAPTPQYTRAILFTLCLLTPAYGQQAQQPRFEVASIKRGGDIFSTKPQPSAGRFAWTTQLSYLIGYAYGVDFSRVSGPGVGTVYSVEAVMDPTDTDSAVRKMVQLLLAERFNLRLHSAVTETDGYAISMGKGGLKIKESPEPEFGGQEKSASPSYVSAHLPSAGVTEIIAERGSIPQLAEALARALRMPVWDETNLHGVYDFKFRFSEDLNPDASAHAPSLSTALRDNLGLAIQKQRGLIQSLVIDHLEPPTEN